MGTDLLQKIMEENLELKKALKFYANPESWIEHFGERDSFSLAQIDGGEKARLALTS